MNFMLDIKNRAYLNHKGESFVIHQDKNDKWIFTYGNAIDQSTQNKDLQQALNIIYETIDEVLEHKAKAKRKKKK